MFGFGKKKDKKTKMDKLVMGAIIGVAVGSVVGMAVAPQKGSDTRKMIADKGMEAINKGREFGARMSEDSKAKKGLLRRIFGWFFSGKKRKTDILKKIPREQPSNTVR